jgi:hypothetical protein
VFAHPVSAADLARADFQQLTTSGAPGVFDQGQPAFECDGEWFDYVDSEDSSSGCDPDPGAQSGNNNSSVSGGGRWHLNLGEEYRGQNPAKVTFNFSGNEDQTECDRLGDTMMGDLGLDCGCDTACAVNVWIAADRLFKKGASRQTLGRFDIVEWGGDGPDGPDLRIDYHEALYICKVAGREEDNTWRVLQTWDCDGSSGLALADVIIPPVGGTGQDDVLGVWNLPMQVTVHKVPLPSDDGGTPPNCTDNDNDGVCVEDGDCDDNNPDVYPGHNDTRGRWGRDGVDNDCNGVIDG